MAKQFLLRLDHQEARRKETNKAPPTGVRLKRVNSGRQKITLRKWCGQNYVGAACGSLRRWGMYEGRIDNMVCSERGDCAARVATTV